MPSSASAVRMLSYSAAASSTGGVDGLSSRDFSSSSEGRARIPFMKASEESTGSPGVRLHGVGQNVSPKLDRSCASHFRVIAVVSDS